MAVRFTAVGDSMSVASSSTDARKWVYRLMTRMLRGGNAPTFSLYASFYYKLSAGAFEMYIAAVSGQDTSQMRALWPSNVADHPSDVIHILAGPNDIQGGRAANLTQADLQWMVEQGKTLAPKVILATLPPLPAFQTQVNALNTWIRGYCASSGTLLNDLAAIPWSTEDGLHPDAACHARWAQAIDADLMRGIVYDWQVQANGTLRDALSGTLATIVGNGGVLPNVRAWSTIVPGATGYCADFTSAVTVSVPTARMDATQGSVAVLRGNPPSYASHQYEFCWYKDGSNFIGLAGAGGTATGDVFTRVSTAAVAQIATYAPRPLGGGLHLGTWKDGTMPKAYWNNAGAYLAPAVQTSPTGMPATAWIGQFNGAAAFPFGGPISRIVMFSRAIDDEETHLFADLKYGPKVAASGRGNRGIVCL